MAVIDLTGTKTGKRTVERLPIEGKNDEGEDAFAGTLSTADKYTKVHNPGPWLRLKIKDFSAPSWGRDIWKSLAEDIQALLDDGVDVLITCQGGHGRTGLAASILMYLMAPELIGDDDPILWLRDIYCEKVVENDTQITYIYDILGIPDTGEVQGSKKYGSGYSKAKTSTPTKGGGDKGGGWQSHVPYFDRLMGPFSNNQ